MTIFRFDFFINEGEKMKVKCTKSEIESWIAGVECVAISEDSDYCSIGHNETIKPDTI